MPAIRLGLDHIDIETMAFIARDRAAVRIDERCADTILKSRAWIEKWVAEGRAVYGVTTGFGALCDVVVSAKDVLQLQQNILVSHAAGVGAPLPEDVVRATMAVRVHDLAKGYAGIRMQTIQALVDLLNAGISPIVPEKGSVGASGDLSPMSHLALVLIGLGEAEYRGRRLPGGQALREAGLAPIRLEAGEGLALINGTQVMTAITALTVLDAVNLAKCADIACALTLETTMGTNAEFDRRIHEIRPHPGQIAAADNMFRLTRDSGIISSHKGCSRIQDAYTLRCSPQIHGASKDALAHVRRVVETEINSSTTNPLVFHETGDFLLGGNFHGQPVALVADYLSIALSELANVSERRIERLVNPQHSGLPAFLVAECGLNSGYMLAQYTAAALVSENKSLAHPASVDSIPTSANKEDHVSMGTIAARKARMILENAAHVIAIELMCGCQALDLLTEGTPGPGTLAAYECVRERIPRLDQDRVIAEDIRVAAELVKSGEVARRVEAAVGPLN